MRFEIEPNGGFVIFVGLLVLLSSVFVLGMISERQMEQGQQDQSQLVSVYPMPTAGPSASLPQVVEPAAPVVAAVPKRPSRVTVASENLPRVAVPKLAHAHRALPHPALANVLPAHRSAAIRQHKYKIMIDTAMDRVAADRMVSRLLGLGYTARTVPSQIDGQTWYRVQVGPYSTADAAGAAQEKLQAAYTARYINRARAGSTGSTDTDTSDNGAANTD